jgi:predicted CopG family antitoxin
MATHTVALDEEVYELLRRVRKPEESFSGAVKRLARPHRSLASFAGM